ncbi:protein kinase [Streptomyces sp. NPDC020096]
MVGGYRLAARLGSGGMGRVYLSYTPGGRAVAIKVIRPEFAEDPEFRRRFRQEAQAAQRVQGLCTAPVIASDTGGPQPWLATAYVPGPTLAAAVAEHGPLATSTVLLLVAGIAEALQSIHGAGIVHRDLKPSNVLLASDGPRVIDFGIARAADATALTGNGIVVGTPAFMAPEQAAAGRISAATDVFALGQVTAFAALGTPVYGEGSSHAVLYRIVHEDPDVSALPTELLPVVTRCLAKDPAQRPSLAEVIALCQAATDQTQLRRPEGWLPDPIAATIIERHAAPSPGLTAPITQPNVPCEPQAAQAPTQPARSHPRSPAPVAFPPGAPPPRAVLPSAIGSGYPQYPIPQQPRKRRRAVVLASVLGLPLLLFGGCAALVHAVNGSTGSGTGTATQHNPKPSAYPDVHLPAGYHLEFADDPLQPKNSNYDDLYYVCDASSCDFGSYNTKLILLDRAEKGSLDTCRRETRFTQQIPQDRLSNGSQICARTPAGDVALVTFKGVSSKSDPSRYVTLDATVWRHTVDAG